VTARSWPADEPAIPLAGDGTGRLPAGEGRHLLVLGATGAGKTVTGRRWICARTLAHDAAALVVDPKDDPELAEDLRRRPQGRAPIRRVRPLGPSGGPLAAGLGEDPGAVLARVCAPSESLTDNFAGFVIKRQTSAESGDWCAKLLGTREIWQSTDRTEGHGARGEGSGSRRRAAEFVVPADRFKTLGVGRPTCGPPSACNPTHARPARRGAAPSALPPHL